MRGRGHVSLLSLARRYLLVACLGAVLLISACQSTKPDVTDGPMDPQWLVGRWEGEHFARSDHQRNVINLTITRVEGNHVFGSMEFYFRRGQRVHEIEGTLQGNKLTSGQRFYFTVYGRRMTGTAPTVGEQGWDLELTKR